MSKFHIIINEESLILARETDATFLNFQDIYPDFMTSLGPMTGDEVIDLFEAEWPDILALNHERMRTFVDAQCAEQTLELQLTIDGT